MEPVNEIVEPDNAKILMRQTSYTLDECIELLKTKTLEESIKDFLGIVEKKEETGTTNQKIFRSILEHFYINFNVFIGSLRTEPTLVILDTNVLSFELYNPLNVVTSNIFVELLKSNSNWLGSAWTTCC